MKYNEIIYCFFLLVQNYIWDQFDNIKFVNLVVEMIKFLNILYFNINEEIMLLVVQLFDMFVEFIFVNIYYFFFVFFICELCSEYSLFIFLYICIFM